MEKKLKNGNLDFKWVWQILEEEPIIIHFTTRNNSKVSPYLIFPPLPVKNYPTKVPFNHNFQF